MTALAPVTLSLIAAVAENGVIGQDGGMPWRLSSDMKRFKALTMGRPVVMGRKTFEAIGKPLAGRANFVITRREEFSPEGVVVAPSLAAAIAAAEDIAKASGDEEIMVIGGGEIYAAALPMADRLYITHVEGRPEGDATFPAIDAALWRATSAVRTPAGPRDSEATIFVVYERIGPAGG